jgi:hypothetical protein
MTLATMPSSWVTAPLTNLRCPHKIGGAVCGHIVIQKLGIPPNWHVYTRPLVARGPTRGLVKQCPSCDGHVEIVIHILRPQ